jgi:hypothetical protein
MSDARPSRPLPVRSSCVTLPSPLHETPYQLQKLPLWLGCQEERAPVGSFWMDALNRRSACPSLSTAAATGVGNDGNTKIEERRIKRLIMSIGMALCVRGEHGEEKDVD